VPGQESCERTHWTTDAQVTEGNKVRVKRGKRVLLIKGKKKETSVTTRCAHGDGEMKKQEKGSPTSWKEKGKLGGGGKTSRRLHQPRIYHSRKKKEERQIHQKKEEPSPPNT